MSGDEERLVKHLTEAVCALTEAVKRSGGLAYMVTRFDLAQTEARLLAAIAESKTQRRFTRLQVASVRFVQPTNGTKPMAENIGIDIPAGKIARVQFKPVDEKGKATKIDGPVQAKVLEDPTSPAQPPAEVVVGGLDGLFVDIKLPDTEGAIASVEVGGDPNEAPGRVDEEVITTLVTVRRLGEVPGKAVILGATPETVTFPAADQFGVFA